MMKEWGMNRFAAGMACGVAAWLAGPIAQAQLSGPPGTQSIPVHARLKPVAHTGGKGSGVLTGTFNQYTHEFAWRVTYQNLSSPVFSAKIHGPSHPGQDAPVILPLPPPLGSPIIGVMGVGGGTAAEITGGYAYVVLGTANHPAGELRGRIRRGK
jgi:hypothetical protein